MNLGQVILDVREIVRLPKVSVDLMFSRTKGNDSFYRGMVRDFYKTARKRHRKMPLIRALEYGVALCRLPACFDDYFMLIEASARRNYKKAVRNGYVFSRIQFNNYVSDIKEIRLSTTTRQGSLSDAFLEGEVALCTDPPSTTTVHDYAYYGVRKNGMLRAYAGCLIAGELCMVEQIYGHAKYQADGVVPLLIIGMAQDIMENHERVKFYGYGSFYGAGITMRRFKRKFGFLPKRVTWRLGDNNA